MASDGETSCITDPNFAVICSFLEKFGTQCGLRCPDFLELQEMLENTEVLAPQLIELHLKLLRRIKKSVSFDRWERVLIKVCHTFSSQDAWELERFGYKKARISSKVRILKQLMEMQFDCHLKFKAEVNRLTADDLRVQPIGRDKHGHSYWYLIDEQCQLRVYREDPDEETWELVAKNREGLVQLIKQLASGEIDIADLDSNLNEDSNSLEIAKPVTDTGQLNATSPSAVEPSTIESSAGDQISNDMDIDEKEVSDEKSNIINLEHKEDSKENGNKLSFEEPALTQIPEPEIPNNETIPEFRKIKLTVRNFNKPHASVGLDLSVSHKSYSIIPNNKGVDLTNKKKKSINDVATDLRIKTQVKSQINVQEQEIDLSVKKSVDKYCSLNESSFEPVNMENALKLTTGYPSSENDDSQDDFDDSDEINLPSHMKHPRLDRPTLLGKSKKFNKSFSDEEYDEDEIVEPVIYIRGEGSGKDCNNENKSDFNKEQYSEAIEEPIMFFCGQGSGQDCETGNAEKDKETGKNTMQIEAGTSNQLDSVGANLAKIETNINTCTDNQNILNPVDCPDSDYVKDDTKIVSPNSKIGKIIFDSVASNQKSEKSPKKISRWDVKREINEIDIESEKTCALENEFINKDMIQCAISDCNDQKTEITDICPIKGKVKNLISKWEEVTMSNSKQCESYTETMSNLSTDSDEKNEKIATASKSTFFFGPNSLNNNPFFQTEPKTSNIDLISEKDNIALKDNISENIYTDISNKVPISKADNLIDNMSSELISSKPENLAIYDNSNNDNCVTKKLIATNQNPSNLTIDDNNIKSKKLSVDYICKKEEKIIVEAEIVIKKSNLPIDVELPKHESTKEDNINTDISGLNVVDDLNIRELINKDNELCGKKVVGVKVEEQDKETLQIIHSKDSKHIYTKFIDSSMEDCDKHSSKLILKDDSVISEDTIEDNTKNIHTILSHTLVEDENLSGQFSEKIKSINTETNIPEIPSTSKIPTDIKCIDKIIIDENVINKVTKSDKVFLEINKCTNNLGIDNTSNLDKESNGSETLILEEKSRSSTDALLSDIEKLCAEEAQDEIKELLEKKKEIGSPMNPESLIGNEIRIKKKESGNIILVEKQCEKLEQNSSNLEKKCKEGINKPKLVDNIITIENLNEELNPKIPIIEEKLLSHVKNLTKNLLSDIQSNDDKTICSNSEENTYEKNLGIKTVSDDNICIKGKLKPQILNQIEMVSEKKIDISNVSIEKTKSDNLITTDQSTSIEAKKKDSVKIDLLQEKCLSGKNTVLEESKTSKDSNEKHKEKIDDISFIGQVEKLEEKSIDDTGISVEIIDYSKKDKRTASAEHIKKIEIKNKEAVVDDALSSKQIIYEDLVMTSTEERNKDIKENKNTFSKDSVCEIDSTKKTKEMHSNDDEIESKKTAQDSLESNIKSKKLLLEVELQEKKQEAIEFNEILMRNESKICELLTDKIYDEHNKTDNIKQKFILKEESDKKLKIDTKAISQIDEFQNEKTILCNQSSKVCKLETNIVETKKKSDENIFTIEKVDDNESITKEIFDNKTEVNTEKIEQFPSLDSSQLENSKEKMNISEEIIKNINISDASSPLTIDIEEKKITKTDKKFMKKLCTEKSAEETLIQKEKVNTGIESSINQFENYELKSNEDTEDTLKNKEATSNEKAGKINTNSEIKIVEKIVKGDTNVNVKSSLMEIKNEMFENMELVDKTEENPNINLKITVKNIESKESKTIDNSDLIKEKLLDDKNINVTEEASLLIKENIECKTTKTAVDETHLNLENITLISNLPLMKKDSKKTANEDVDIIKKMFINKKLTSNTDESYITKQNTKSEIIENRVMEMQTSIKEDNIHKKVESSMETLKDIELDNVTQISKNEDEYSETNADTEIEKQVLIHEDKTNIKVDSCMNMTSANSTSTIENKKMEIQLSINEVNMNITEATSMQIDSQKSETIQLPEIKKHISINEDEMDTKVQVYMKVDGETIQDVENKEQTIISDRKPNLTVQSLIKTENEKSDIITDTNIQSNEDKINIQLRNIVKVKSKDKLLPEKNINLQSPSMKFADAQLEVTKNINSRDNMESDVEKKNIQTKNIDKVKTKSKKKILDKDKTNKVETLSEINIETIKTKQKNINAVGKIIKEVFPVIQKKTTKPELIIDRTTSTEKQQSKIEEKMPTDKIEDESQKITPFSSQGNVRNTISEVLTSEEKLNLSKEIIEHHCTISDDENTGMDRKSMKDKELLIKSNINNKFSDDKSVEMKLTEPVILNLEELPLSLSETENTSNKINETNNENNKTSLVPSKTELEENLFREKINAKDEGSVEEIKADINETTDCQTTNIEKNSEEKNNSEKLFHNEKLTEEINRIDIKSKNIDEEQNVSKIKNLFNTPQPDKHSQDVSFTDNIKKNTKLEEKSNSQNSVQKKKSMEIDQDVVLKKIIEKDNVTKDISKDKSKDKCTTINEEEMSNSDSDIIKSKLSEQKKVKKILHSEKSCVRDVKENLDHSSIKKEKDSTKDCKKVDEKQCEIEELSETKKDEVFKTDFKLKQSQVIIKDIKLFKGSINNTAETDNYVNKDTDEEPKKRNKKKILKGKSVTTRKKIEIIESKISVKKDIFLKSIQQQDDIFSKHVELEEPTKNITTESKMTRTRAKNIKNEAAKIKNEDIIAKDDDKKICFTRSSKRLSDNKNKQKDSCTAQNKNIKMKIEITQKKKVNNDKHIKKLEKIDNETVSKINVKSENIKKDLNLSKTDPLESNTNDYSSDGDNCSIGFNADAQNSNLSDAEHSKEVIPAFVEVKEIRKPLLTVIDISKLQKRPDDEPKSEKKPKNLKIPNAIDSPIYIENEESSDVIDISETDPLACTEEDFKPSGPSKPAKQMTLATFKIDSDDNEENALLEPIRKNLRRRQININVTKTVTRKRAREPEIEISEVIDTKKRKTRGRRSIDLNLRRNIEEQKRKEAVSSDDEEEKVKKTPKPTKMKLHISKKSKEEVIKIDKSIEESKRISGRGRVKAIKDSAVVNESPVPNSDIPSEVSRTDTTATPTSVPKKKPGRKKKSRVLGLDIDTSAILPEKNDKSDRNVRQSRRIAQIKIKEEAERKNYDDIGDSKGGKKKKIKKNEDKVYKVPTLSTSSKKKKKGKAVSEEEESEEEDDEEIIDNSKKKHKKRKIQDLRRLFNMNNPWRSSSESSSHEEEEEEVEEEISEDDKEILRSDHEFSPESDLENITEIQPTRRARTVKKESDTEDPTDVHACQKCSKSDHPEWILLCDGCDCGWHCSCLRPALLVIPEGDWFCPPCQHLSLITALRNQLTEYDKRADRLEMEVRRKERIAYIGISLDNVLSNKEQNQDNVDTRDNEESDDDSRDSGSSSGSSSGDESEPIYQLRERRQAYSYRFNDYDDLINSAIQDEIEAGKIAGNQGRGKDIATIVNAKKDDVEEQAKLETQTPAELEMPAVVPTDEHISKPLPLHDKSGESGGNEEESEEELRVVPKHMGRKKHRKLNSLDINSEDDVDSDEDFKGDSASEEEDFEEDVGSYDSDDSNFRGKRRGGPVRRSTRARVTRYDREFINDDTDEDTSTRKKKSRSMWDESASEDSDKSWGRRGKYKKRQFPSKIQKKSKKKRKRLEDSDGEIKPKIKRPRIKYGGLDESEDEILSRRTRGKRMTYVDTLGSDSEEETTKPKSKARIIESEDEYIANEEEEDELVEEAVVTDKEEIETGNIEEDIPPVVPKKIIKLPALAKIPKSPRARGRGRGLGVAQRQTNINFTISPIKFSLTDSTPIDKNEVQKEFSKEELDELPHLDIPVIAENPEGMDDEQVGMMMEEEEFANKQLELMAIQLAKEKKKKELEAQKIEESIAPQIIEQVEKPEPKKRGRRKKYVEGVSPLKQQLQQAKIVPPVIITKALINPQPVLDSNTSLEDPEQEQDKPTVPVDSTPIPTVVQDLSVTPPKRRGRGKGKKTLAAEQAAAIATVTITSENSTTNTSTIPITDNPSTSSTTSSESQANAPAVSPEPSFHSGKLGIATPPQPFTQSQPTPSVITRMLQSQPLPSQTFTTAANAMNQKYFGGMNTEQPRPIGNQFPGLLPRGRVPSPYRQNIPINHYPGVRAPLTPGSPHRLRSPGPPNMPQMFHSPHHPLDPSPSGGGHITSTSTDRQSPADGTSKSVVTPSSPQYNRTVVGNRFPNTNESTPGPSVSPVRPHHIPFSTGSHIQPSSPPRSSAGGGNFSPYHPPPPPNYHYGAYPPPPSLAAADDALPPTVYQSSPYSEQFNPVDSVGVAQTSEESNSKPFDEEGSGEFGGLVSYFSSQREDDLDA